MSRGARSPSPALQIAQSLAKYTPQIQGEARATVNSMRETGTQLGGGHQIEFELTVHPATGEDYSVSTEQSLHDVTPFYDRWGWRQVASTRPGKMPGMAVMLLELAASAEPERRSAPSPPTVPSVRPDDFTRPLDRGLSVVNRPREEYDPLGLHPGQFELVGDETDSGPQCLELRHQEPIETLPHVERDHRGGRDLPDRQGLRRRADRYLRRRPAHHLDPAARGPLCVRSRC